MPLSIHDTTVDTYLRIGTAIAGVLDKGAAHCAEEGIALDEIAGARLAPDMADLRFQVSCVAHHSIGAIRACDSGEFGPPTGYESLGYADLQQLLGDTLVALSGLDKAHVDGLGGGQVTFRLGEMEIPFTTENFLLSFSLPNFFFHATTAYDILRHRGVPLGKRDFLGQMRVGV